MVWAAISIDGKSELYIVDGMMNATKYVDVLQTHLFPFLETLNTENVIFQQDNAPCHKARLTKDFITDKNLETLKWPPYSPDLNLIENVWGWMKNQVQKYLPQTKEELIAIIRKSWDDLPQDFIRCQYASMGRRLAAVIRAQGGNTRY